VGVHILTLASLLGLVYEMHMVMQIRAVAWVT